MSNQTDRDIIDALLRQMDPYNTPQGSPDVLAQLGARLESAGTQLEGSLQGRNQLERFAELIPRWLAANPMQEAGALMQMRQPEVEQLKTMARQAAADPMGTAEAVGRAGVGAIKDPLGTAEKLSLPDIMGGGKALTSLGRMGRKLRGPDLIESVMPEAKVERPKTRQERNQELFQESLDRGEVPGERTMAAWREQLKQTPARPEGSGQQSRVNLTRMLAIFRKLPDIEKARFDRAIEQGWKYDVFHGTKGDITEFDPGLLGESTGAESARLGFFFSADKNTASRYAQNVDAVTAGRVTQAEVDALEREYQQLQRTASKKMTEIEKPIIDQIGIPILNRGLDELYAKYEQMPAEWKYADEVSLSRRRDEKEFIEGVRQHEALVKEIEEVQEALQAAEELKWEKLRDIPEYQQLSSEVDALEGIIDRSDYSGLGDNIMPAKLQLENPLEFDFEGDHYRGQTYHELLQKAKAEGHDGAIFRNTYDGADMTDIYVVFDPSQIRSRYAMFDPEKSASREVISGAAPVVLPLGAGAAAEAYMANDEGRDFSWSNMAGPAMMGMAGVPSARLRKGLAQRSKKEANEPGKTDLGQIAATFNDKRFDWPDGARVLDLGGGKSDKAKEFMAGRGVQLDVIDPIQRPESHNNRILDEFEKNPADIVTVNNVLNVIQEPGLRKQALRGAKALVKPGGEVRIKIYEGSGSGKGNPTSTGSWQENRKTKDYLSEVISVFGKNAVSTSGSYLIAKVK